MWSLDRTLVLCVRHILCPLSYTLNPVVCLKKKSLASNWVKIATGYKMDSKEQNRTGNRDYGSICRETEPQVISEARARSLVAQGGVQVGPAVSSVLNTSVRRHR